MGKKTTKRKIKRGAPSKIEKFNLKQVKVLYNIGFTDKKVSSFFGITKTTLNRWKKKYPDLCASIKDWKVEADARVERSLYESALGFMCKIKKAVIVSDGKNIGSHIEMVNELHQVPPNATSMIFWLKNRKPNEWRDKHEFVIDDYRHKENEGKSVDDLIKEAEEIANRLIKGREALSNN